ncbi:hypothetical protein SAMN06296386_11914 [Lachnospiraceae bacterium]|nr:hypothetical protein SAMN06296386_11914 [Lachnospiraceae bacterium]
MNIMEVNANPRNRCYRCLLEEIDPVSYERDIRRILDMMRPGEKVHENLYQMRLDTCRQCEYLNNGTCTACGCYVELRAAGLQSRCPYKNW